MAKPNMDPQRKTPRMCSRFAAPPAANMHVREPPDYVAGKPLGKGATGTVYARDARTVAKVQQFFRSEMNEAQNQCQAHALGIAPAVTDAYVFRRAVAARHALFEAIEMDRLDATLDEAVDAGKRAGWKTSNDALDAALERLAERVAAAGDSVCDLDLHTSNVMLRHVRADDPRPVEALVTDWDPAASATSERACDALHESRPEELGRGLGMFVKLMRELRGRGIDIEHRYPRTVAAMRAHGYPPEPAAPASPDPWDE